MDLMMFAIGISIAFVGAFFFGMPIGIEIGKRREIKRFEQNYFVHPLPPACVRKARERLAKRDVLNAEYID